MDVKCIPWMNLHQPKEYRSHRVLTVSSHSRGEDEEDNDSETFHDILNVNIDSIDFPKCLQLCKKYNIIAGNRQLRRKLRTFKAELERTKVN